jgi:hypothetical protein
MPITECRGVVKASYRRREPEKAEASKVEPESAGSLPEACGSGREAQRSDRSKPLGGMSYAITIRQLRDKGGWRTWGAWGLPARRPLT